MLKNMIKGAVIGAAVLGLVGTATAADYELNLAGASAQHKFWNAAVPSFMEDSIADGGLGCENVTTTKDADGKHGMSIGQTCDLSATDADNIIIRYSSKNSSYGIGVPCGIASYSTEDNCPTGQILMCDVDDGCDAGKTCQPVHVGASDVELTSFTQTQVLPAYTYDYSTDSKKYCTSEGNQSDEFLTNNCDQILDGTDKSVVIPFGFFVNNGLTQYRCTEPGPTDDEGDHYAYPHWGWQCDPDNSNQDGTNPDCIGYFKCVNDVCTGGANEGGDCSTNGNLDCPDDLADTKCEAMPLDNLSRLMVLQIFSSDNEDWLDRWNQFGPWYPDAGIVRCMRCAGSGTHATLDMQVFRGDATIMDQSLYGRFYHHKSSSDLTKCVDKNGWNPAIPGDPWGTDDRYGVGYADVDKILKSTSYPNTHIVKYQGVEPARAKIENNEYNFWAAQTLYWSTQTIQNAGLSDLLVKLRDAAKNAAFLNDLEPQKYFWTTPAQMAGQKVPNERAYPTVVSGHPDGPF